MLKCKIKILLSQIDEYCICLHKISIFSTLIPSWIFYGSLQSYLAIPWIFYRLCESAIWCMPHQFTDIKYAITSFCIFPSIWVYISLKIMSFQSSVDIWRNYKSQTQSLSKLLIILKFENITNKKNR